MSRKPTLTLKIDEGRKLSLVPAKIINRRTSLDGSVKYIILYDDKVTVEAVYLPSGETFGLCLSTQVGCNMGCTFCATARTRVIRSLSHAEIVAQAIEIVKDLENNRRFDFVTLAGMGEPLANYRNSLIALDFLKGLFPTLDVCSISTVGLVGGIRRLANEQVSHRLYVSLHGATDGVRSSIIPTARSNPIAKLIPELERYADQAGYGSVRLSYLLLPGINDAENDLSNFISILKSRPFIAQILLWNGFGGATFQRASEASALNWSVALNSSGIPAYVSRSYGGDIGAACGQLTGGTRSSFLE